MPGRSRLIGLLLALLAAGAPAGEIRINEWPTQFIPLELTAIPVIMDVGYWMEISAQDVVIKLHPTSINTYEGSVDLRVKTNFYATMSCTIHPTGAVPGTYSTWIEGMNMDPPGGICTVGARLVEPNLTGVPGGSKNVHVATVVVKVVPRM